MSQTLRNSEIVELYPEQIESKQAFIVGVKDTSNPEVKQIEIAQAVQLREQESGILSTLMGWNNQTILRAWQNVSTTVLEQLNPQEGELVNEAFPRVNLRGSFNLQIEEYTEETNALDYEANVVSPARAGRNGASPKINPSTNETITFNSNPVYRKVTVVSGVPRHVLLQSDSVVQRTLAGLTRSEA